MIFSVAPESRWLLTRHCMYSYKSSRLTKRFVRILMTVPAVLNLYLINLKEFYHPSLFLSAMSIITLISSFVAVKWLSCNTFNMIISSNIYNIYISIIHPIICYTMSSCNITMVTQQNLVSSQWSRWSPNSVLQHPFRNIWGLQYIRAPNFFSSIFWKGMKIKSYDKTRFCVRFYQMD